ncbi:dihydrolipoyl dehydrogenase [Liquorilactobacillus mali]|uniref:Dihydrolipoyl dehydrogenase n=1 Tax=Liquorilactobacillus mali KCTC 3596 = DSM 20444 TaxID=1046596 RepID=A0A0R2DZF1_9LACO|nr:dihydrolipoyl dehydrogenase [Liquorilactobacillus mali]KRN09288.1 dihydrolipoamide dehydrogenase [Liquorilactobacillus mali KCTC 3596 = DSM 20444]MDC7952563.1 dihydrolipoyl dehydrogenase [Liquorilactobacillus mali]QFQ73705.1 dihydrolipoyl dehydrogenase [Liquorilactobacillus mali]
MVVGDFAIELDTVVIGAGPGGYVAAIRAAEKGQKVTVIEKEYIGGVCLNVGCIPSKALIEAAHRYQRAMNSSEMGLRVTAATLDFKQTQKWKQESVVDKLTGGVAGLFKKHHIDVIWGSAFLKDDHSLRVMTDDSAQTYSFNNLIIATGSHPIEIPNFKFKGRVLDSTGALALQEVPKNLIVVGGGYIGCELASAYANLGAHVSILEGADRILANYEKDLVSVVEHHFSGQHVDIYTNAVAKMSEQTDKGVKIKFDVNGEEKELAADYCIVCVGRKPNTADLGLEHIGVKIGDRGLIEVDAQCRTSIDNIYAVGDVIPGAALAHKASYEGKIAAEAISGSKGIVDYRAMPAVCYTDSEIATTGLTVAEAKEQGLDVKKAQFPFAANGRAISMSSTNGFVRLVFEKDSQAIVGAQIVGPNASDLITELTLAIETGATIEDVSLTIHPHPSVSEAVMDATDIALGLPINI